MVLWAPKNKFSLMTGLDHLLPSQELAPDGALDRVLAHSEAKQAPMGELLGQLAERMKRGIMVNGAPPPSLRKLIAAVDGRLSGVSVYSVDSDWDERKFTFGFHYPEQGEAGETFCLTWEPMGNRINSGASAPQFTFPAEVADFVSLSLRGSLHLTKEITTPSGPHVIHTWEQVTHSTFDSI
jgi:hypothetical protein